MENTKNNQDHSWGPYRDHISRYDTYVKSAMHILWEGINKNLNFEKIQSSVRKEKNKINFIKYYDLLILLSEEKNKFIRNNIIYELLRSTELNIKLGLVVHEEILKSEEVKLIRLSHRVLNEQINFRERIKIMFGYALVKNFSDFKKLKHGSKASFIYKYKSKSIEDRKWSNDHKELNYIRIFKGRREFEVFNTFSENIKNPLADYSFIFRKMQKDGHIYSDVKESAFRIWLEGYKDIVLDKLKLLDYSTTKSKESLYTIIKNNIQLH